MKKLPFILILLLIVGCSNASFDVSPAMERFYVESEGLQSRTVDSINRFDDKVDGFTVRYPDALDHYRYPQIKENIKVALVIKVDTAWAGADSVNFEFGN